MEGDKRHIRPKKRGVEGVCTAEAGRSNDGCRETYSRKEHGFKRNGCYGSKQGSGSGK